MSAMTLLIFAAVAFVVTHLGLAGPMRHALVRMLGEKGYMLLYSLIAFASIGAMAHFYGEARATANPLWGVNEFVWVPASIVMWVACILFLGSLRKNPAFPHPGAERMRFPEKAKGVYAITRHPMMWAFALWGLVHLLVNPTLPSFMISAAIVIVALAGAAAQDERKALTTGEPFRDWQQRTAFVPFTKGFDFPDRFSFYGGTVLFFGATLAHKWLADMPAGFWRYF